MGCGVHIDHTLDIALYGCSVERAPDVCLALLGMRVLALLAVLVSGVASASDMERVRRASVELLPGQPPFSVKGSLGVPDKTEHKTCGAETKHPWSCMVWIYEGAGGVAMQRLVITFQYSQAGSLAVNGWRWE